MDCGWLMASQLMGSSLFWFGNLKKRAHRIVLMRNARCATNFGANLQKAKVIRGSARLGDQKKSFGILENEDNKSKKILPSSFYRRDKLFLAALVMFD